MKTIIISAVSAVVFATGFAAANPLLNTTDPVTDFTLVESTGKTRVEFGSSFGAVDIRSTNIIDTVAGSEGYDKQAPYNVAH